MGKINTFDMLPKLPKRSLLYILICGGGIFLFCLIGIYPNQRALLSLDAEISTLNRKIQEQERLFPVFKKMLSHIGQSAGKNAPAGIQERLRKENIVSFSDVLGEHARNSGLDIGENTLDIRRFKEKGGFLELSVSLTGNLDDFRTFITRINALSYDIRINRLEIRPVSDQKEFQLGLWLPLE